LQNANEVERAIDLDRRQGRLSPARARAMTSTLALPKIALDARFARLYLAHVFVLFALLIGFGIEAILRRILNSTPLVYLGSLSYAIYLVHWPLLFVMLEQHELPPALYYLAVVGAAILTHHVVEVPARRFIMQYAQHAPSA
jgi:peptidoglycan/LPS O-acetylase OafA/YrhL